MKLLITDLDYVIENDELIARCFGRSETGTREIVYIIGTRPFFLVRADANIPNDLKITGIEEGWVDLKGNPLKRIFVRFPKDVAQRVKCRICSGGGKVMSDGKMVECGCKEGMVELGLRGKFDETWQADVVFEQVLRIYYGLVGVIEVPGNRCRIEDVRRG